MMPLISVIVPMYKVEPYLAKCIHGITTQTYENLEIILVDDGSPDRSGELAEEFAREDDRIRVIHKANGGAATARNAGLDVSTGDYMIFIDADDSMDEDYIMTLYEALERHDASIAICDYQAVDEKGAYFEMNEPIDFNREMVLTGDEVIHRELQGRWEYVAPWGKIFPAELWKNLRFPETNAHEDEYVFPRVFDGVARVAMLPQRKYYYLQHSDSLMGGGYNSTTIGVYITLLTDRIHFYQEKGREDMLALVIQSYLAWIVDAFRFHGDVMTAEQAVFLKQEIKKYKRFVMAKPYLYHRKASVKLWVKCKLVLWGRYDLPKGD